MNGMAYFDASVGRRREHLENGSRPVVVVTRRQYMEGVIPWSKNGRNRDDGSVRVEHVAIVDPTNPEDLRGHVDESFFHSADAWLNSIRSRSVWMEDEAHLYRVEPAVSSGNR